MNTNKITMQITVNSCIFPELHQQLTTVPARDRHLVITRYLIAGDLLLKGVNPEIISGNSNIASVSPASSDTESQQAYASEAAEALLEFSDSLGKKMN